MRLRQLRGVLVLTCALCLAGATPALAVVTGYVNNPGSNSTDWATAMGVLGAPVNTTVNLNAHPAGPLQPNFYLASGVTLTGSGGLNTVVFGAGPGQAGVSPPLSTGEGPHAASNFINGPAVASTLTISFNQGVAGVGVFVIDLFNPSSQPTTRNPVSMQAFAGPNGTGASLGVFDSAQFNFQPNNQYFMGVGDTASGIRSLVVTQPGLAADIIGIDDIRFAIVPEPASAALATIAGALALCRRRR